MPGIIRADTDQLRSVARQMRTTVDQIDDGTNAMQQSVQALDAVWSGNARDRGIAYWERIFPNYRPNVERLVHFANELEALAQRLDDAAAVFGAGALGATGATAATATGSTRLAQPAPPHDAPDSMFEIFGKLREGDEEIKVIRIGDNEYAVTIDGTEMDGLVGGNSWANAAGSFLGFNTDFTDRVRDALKSIPSGATVHMFGYSQGGIIAQDLAMETGLFEQQGIKLESVTTFGSPELLSQINSNARYISIDAPGDIIGNPITAVIRDAPESILQGNFFRLNPLAAHGSYEDANSYVGEKMINMRPPFSKVPPDRWEIYPKDGRLDPYDLDSQTVTAREVANEIGHKAKETVHKVMETGNKAIDTANSIGHFIKDKVPFF